MFLFDKNVSESFKIQNKKNFYYYHPFETDTSLSIIFELIGLEEKNVLIDEWYLKAKNNYKKEDLNK